MNLNSPTEITHSPKSRADKGGRKFRLFDSISKIYTKMMKREVPLVTTPLTSAGEGISKARKM